MKLMVIVLCLLSERFLIHTISYQRFAWFGDYSQFINKHIENNHFFNNQWVKLAAIILPIILIVSIIYFLFGTILFGFAGLILSIIIFYYCLGPQNPFYPLSSINNDSHNQSVGNYFAQVNSQLFALIFWYIIGGPITAVAYRLITLCQNIDSVNKEAVQATEILEWIPARITALLYLLVGNFQRGFSIFINYFIVKPDANSKLLSECGIQAVQVTDSDEVPIPVAETLVEHATIVLLVFIALFTLIAWL